MKAPAAPRFRHPGLCVTTMNALDLSNPRRWLLQWSRGELAPRQWIEALAAMTLAAGLYCTLSTLGFGDTPRPALSLIWGAWISTCLGLVGWSYLALQRRITERGWRRAALLAALLTMPVLMALGERTLAMAYWNQAFTLQADHVLSRLPFSLLLLAAIELPLWIGTRYRGSDSTLAAAAQPSPRPAAPASTSAPVAPRFRIATRSGIRVLESCSIKAVRSAGNYVEFFAGGEVLLHRETLANVERELAAHGVMRVHRSHLVRIGEVERIVKHRGNGWTLRLRDGSDVPVGRAFQPAVEQALVTRH